MYISLKKRSIVLKKNNLKESSKKKASDWNRSVDQESNDAAMLALSYAVIWSLMFENAIHLAIANKVK